MKASVRKRWERANALASFYFLTGDGCCGSPACPFKWSHVGERMVCHQDLTPLHETAASLCLDGLDISELP